MRSAYYMRICCFGKVELQNQKVNGQIAKQSPSQVRLFCKRLIRTSPPASLGSVFYALLDNFPNFFPSELEVIQSCFPPSKYDSLLQSFQFLPPLSQFQFLTKEHTFLWLTLLGHLTMMWNTSNLSLGFRATLVLLISSPPLCLLISFTHV